MNTTTLRTILPTPKPSDEDGDDSTVATIFLTAVVVLLLFIVGFAAIYGRFYRRRRGRRQCRVPSSPTLIYSVTLHGASGSAFTETIQEILRESRRRDNDDSAVVCGDAANDEQREITCKTITGLPSYEESIRTRAPAVLRNKDSVKESPPPYTENESTN